MIDRLELLLRKVRRFASASEWGVRLLRFPPFDGDATRRGLVMVQIDGLSERRFEEALANGTMPFLRRLRDHDGYRALPFYCGMPSTTPAVQGELFYGVRGAVPAFSFVDRRSGRVVKMYEHDPARDLEATFPSDAALLAGGSAYCDIYTGGASDTRFCMASMGWSDLVRSSRPLRLPFLALLYLPSLVRTFLLVAGESLRALGGFVEGVRAGESWRAELRFIPTRIAICILLREVVTVGAALDVARGLPVVHVNLIGYDENAHRRGPSSVLAQRALRGIDDCIARLTRAARRSTLRPYDVWVYSDHGQEETDAYVERHGRTVQEAVSEVVNRHLRETCGESGHVPRRNGDPPHGVHGQRVRMMFGERLLRWLIPGADVGVQWAEPGRVTVTAIGPLGHVYLPCELRPEERSALASDLVCRAGIPLVLAADGPYAARAWNRDGELFLPGDAGRVLGPEHPYREAVTRDLIALCSHPLAGDLVLSGWQLDGTPFSFPAEKGAHGGPGPEETAAFVFAPGDTAFVRRGDEPLRPLDLRETAMTVLGRSDAPVVRRRIERRDAVKRIRIMTYNVHSCTGMDGRVSPERIARVIARHEPDIVALQELDVGRKRTHGVDQAHAIAERLEMLFHFHPTIAIEEERFGDAILSAHPMRLIHAGPLPRLSGRPDLEPRGALWVAVEVGGRTYNVVNTHLSLNARERGLQVDSLLGSQWLGHPDCIRGSRILCGDFNALPQFPVCRRITRVLRDSQVGRNGHQPRNTFFSRFPLSRIDYIFVDAKMEVSGVTVPSDSLARVASDHLPLISEVG